MTFREFIRVLEAHGFELDRQRGTSHRIYKKVVRGKTRMVVVACHREGDDIPPRYPRVDDSAIGSRQKAVPLSAAYAAQGIVK